MVNITTKGKEVWGVMISDIMISMDTHRKEVLKRRKQFPSPVLKLYWDIHKKNGMPPQNVWLYNFLLFVSLSKFYLFDIFLKILSDFHLLKLSSLFYIINLFWIYPISIRYQMDTLLKFQLFQILCRNFIFVAIFFETSSLLTYVVDGIVRIQR